MKRVFIMLLLALLAGAGAGFAPLLRKAPEDERVHAELAGTQFAFAPAYARDEGTAAGGLSDRLALLASLPDFAPPAEERRSQMLVKLTLTPKDESPDPQERPAKLYARFLTPETLEGPGGLVLRRFEQESPYETEELLLAPPDGRAFFARCPRAKLGAPGEECLSLFRMGAIDVELRYPAEALGQWDELNEGARAFLTRIGREASQSQPQGRAAARPAR